MTNIAQQVVDHFGSIADTARAFRIAPASVSEWLEKGAIPKGRAMQTHELTRGAFTPHQIDPVGYPNPEWRTVRVKRKAAA